MKNIVKLSNTLINDSKLALNQIGAKAFSIVDMINSGFNVPNGFCITTKCYFEYLKKNRINLNISDETLDKDLNRIKTEILHGDFPSKLLDEILDNEMENNVAVRSSGNFEDLEGASFAGLYETFVNIPFDKNIVLYVKKCWMSVFEKRVYIYSKEKNIDFSKIGLGVIIQDFIPSQKSGVAFGVDPFTGLDKHILIEAVIGLGTSLVSGNVTPDKYIYDWYNKKEVSRDISEKKSADYVSEKKPFIITKNLSPKTSKKAVLSHDEVACLSEVVLNIQTKYGFPVDVEWVNFNNKFYIVQSRPITKICYSGITGQWSTADLRDGGVSSDVCTAFMWSLYERIWSESTQFYLKKVHLSNPNKEIVWGDMFYGRPYWNVVPIKDGLKSIPGFVERDFDEDLGIQVSYEGKGYVSKTTIKTVIQGIKVLFALNKSFKNRIIENEIFVKKQAELLSKIDSIEPSKMSEKEFIIFYKDLILNKYYDIETNYFYNIFNNSNAQTLFKENYNKYKKGKSFLNLMVGIRNISHLKPIIDLWKISRKVKENENYYNFWVNTDISELINKWNNNFEGFNFKEVSDYIKKYGYHSTRELDITVPNYGENPEFVFCNLISMINQSNDNDPEILIEKQHEIYQKERNDFLKQLPFYKRKNFINDLKLCRKLLWWREELRDYSTRMYDLIRKHTLFLAEILMKKEILTDINDIFHIPYYDIFKFLDEEINSNQLNEILLRNKKYYQSFRNYKNPWDIGTGYEKYLSLDKSLKTFKGVPSSPGRVTAPVKIIVDILDSNRIETGDILVTKFTDPAWTPVFNKISGVVTETGGVLSHAAVISREYGIPAVLAVDGITEILKDGQIVTLDGLKGLIFVD